MFLKSNRFDFKAKTHYSVSKCLYIYKIYLNLERDILYKGTFKISGEENFQKQALFRWRSGAVYGAVIFKSLLGIKSIFIESC